MAQVVPAEGDMRRVIGDGEAQPDGEVEGLTDQDLLDLYRAMVLLRTYDERSVVFHRQGRIGTYAIFWGHEAMQAGVVPRARPGGLDLPLLPRVRDRPPPWDAAGDRPLLVARASGRLVGSPRVRRRLDRGPDRDPRPHAVGFAWGKKLRGESACAIAYFGDGATSEGAFHEGANFAAVMRAPAILFCNNNGWAISTPLSAQTRAATLADKAAGYGMPGVRVDGGDVLAVYEATREAVARARAGDGPTFIEAVTYRCAPHATADDPSAYIDPKRVEAERANECVGRYERYLRRLGLLGDDLLETIAGEAREAIRAGIAAAEALPEPDPSLVTRDAYAE